MQSQTIFTIETEINSFQIIRIVKNSFSLNYIYI